MVRITKSQAKKIGRMVGKAIKKTENMAYYASGKGIKYTAKRGKTSEKNNTLRMLNRFEQTRPGVYVKHVYSAKSRVIRPGQTTLAVKLSNGKTGWLTEKGKFIDKEEFRELLHNVDQTSPAAISDVSLLDAWDAMSEAQKAKLVDAMQDFDWKVFWEEIGSDDPKVDLSQATDAYFEFIDTIGTIMGW